jgi:RNA polymerase sigma-54 factor
MALTPRLELRQTQALVMTPQLQQAIKLLQLNNIELAAYVEHELEQNPLLERADSGDGGREEGAAEGREAASEERSEARDTSNLDIDRVVGGDGAAESLDVDYDNVWNNDSNDDAAQASGSGGGDAAFASWGSGGGYDDAGSLLEQAPSREQTLRDHLLSQIGMEFPDPADRVIGAHLVELLDEAGYISSDLEDAARYLGCDVGRVETTLEKLQYLDPPGIFARNLAECLALQLRDRNRLDPAIQALLNNLDLLAKRDISALARVCGVDRQDVVEMIAEVRALDPKPAVTFDHEVAQPVTPDVLMRPNPEGGWIVELNNETLPRVLVNNTYYAKVSKEARGKEEKQYINDCFQTANWLVKSLHQRANTILRVATEIVRQQDAFFRKGVQHLRPLVLRDIAEAIEMHESTVSRVTSNKYIATPRGIFELKYFFTTAISGTADGESHSAEAVRQRIKRLIDDEPPGKVLSDDKIVEILRNDGVDIARRTVAKYRELMGIPSSVRRRREKAGTA